MIVDGLRGQVFGLPQLIRDTTWELEDRARSVLSTPNLLNLRLVVITGSGYSHIAAKAAQFAWQSLGAVPTFADDAMTTARYRLNSITGGQRFHPLLVAVSHSGKQERVIEAAQSARDQGVFVLSVTADRENHLASRSDAVLPTSPLTGVGSYAMSLLALFHVAIRLGEVRGRYPMDDAGAMRRELEQVAEAIESMLDEAEKAARAIAERWAEHHTMEFIGSGPGRVSSDYGAAKHIEAAGIRAHSEDIEEFIHLRQLAGDIGVPVVVVAPSNSAARSRAVDVSALLRSLGRPIATLSDKPLVGGHLPHAPGVREIWHPLLHIAPLALLANELMLLRAQP